MIDKSHLRATMLALTEAELAQAHKTYERFLSGARLDRSEPIENDEQAQAERSADLAEAFDDGSGQNMGVMRRVFCLLRSADHRELRPL